MSSQNRRPLPPANAGVTLDRGVVPAAPETPPQPAAETPPEELTAAPPEPNTGGGDSGRHDQAEGRAEGTRTTRPRRAGAKERGSGSAPRGGALAGLRGMRATGSQIDPERVRHWSIVVGSDAGKAAAAINAAQEAYAQYERSVQAARADGMPERKLMAVVARYEIDLPEPDLDDD
jgi:hypothetical protein